MGKTIIFHVKADLDAAKLLHCELIAQGIDSRCLSVDYGKYPSDEFAVSDSIVGLISINSLEAPEFVECVKSIEAENIEWFPVRIDNVDVKGPLDYYLQLRQWLDIIDGDKGQVQKLASSFSSGTATPFAGKIVNRSKTGGPRYLVWTAVVVAVLCLAVVALVFQFADPGKTPEGSVEPAPIEAIIPAPIISAYMQENSAFPFFDPEGNMLNVSMDVFTRQVRPVKASYYRKVSDNVLEILGDWSGVPKAEYGQQTFSFPIAKEITDGLLCVQYDLEGVDGGRERQIYVQRINADYSKEAPVLARKTNDGESCGNALNMSVDRKALSLLDTRAVLLDAHSNQSITLVDDLVPENGGWRLEVFTASEKYTPPVVYTTLYLFGGDIPEDMKLLLRMRNQDGYPVYYGAQPKHVMLCANSVVGDWTISSIAKGAAINETAYSMEAQKLSVTRGGDVCGNLAGDENDFADHLQWPRGTSLIPPSTNIVNDAKIDSKFFQLAGLRLGMSFEEAVEQTKAAYSDLELSTGSGRSMLNDIYTYALETASPFVSPHLVFENAEYVSFSTQSPIAKIVLVNDGKSATLKAVVVFLQPDIRLVQNRNPFIGTEKFIKDLEELLGVPVTHNYNGQHFDGDSEHLTMVWSGSAQKGCHIEKTDTAIMGTGGRSSMVERWVTTERGICPYSLEVRYGREGYNAVVSYMLIDSNDE